MSNDCLLHEYRIRFRGGGDERERQVYAVADRARHAITLELPDATRSTVDVVTARAVCMVLHEAVYLSLEPSGPFLRLERNHGNGWTFASPQR